MYPLRFRRLAGFSETTDSDIEKIDGPDNGYAVRKSVEMGLQIASGADKDTFNAQYSLMPDDVAENVANWKNIGTPAPAPMQPKTDLAGTTAKALAAAAAITVAGVFLVKWLYPEGHLTRKR